MDWLSLHSPRFVDWNEKWVAFQIKGKWICLQGGDPAASTCTMVQICLMQDSANIPVLIPPEVQAILDQFSLVFTEPSGLPPRRAVSHSIPLIDGARPVQIRPYRLTPELKDEVEKQIAEMLQSGVIRPSNSC